MIDIPNAVAIATVDPGRITGVGRGIFSIADCDSIEAVWASRRQYETWECEGTILEQCAELITELDEWLYWAHIESAIAIPDLHLIFEDFQLRQRSADLTPVQLTAAFETHWPWSDVKIEKQSPSDAKTYATKARLRSWGAWVVGSEHRRDANRHLLLKLSRLLG